MSIPVTRRTACSRLSPHLVAHYQYRKLPDHPEAQREDSAGFRKDRGRWQGAAQSAFSTLIGILISCEKLRQEPKIEWLPMARLYEGLRPVPNDDTLFIAFPKDRQVSVCRRLHALPENDGMDQFSHAHNVDIVRILQPLLPCNDRRVLARLFTDYEPGIHWPQSQIQSARPHHPVRIYSPVNKV